MPDPVADFLRSLHTSDRVRAAAWDAVYATDDAEAQSRLEAILPLSPAVKAQLWDLRGGGTLEGTPQAPQTPRVEDFIETPEGVMPDAEWAALTPGDKARNVLQWGGKAIARMTGIDPAVVDNPGLTLASAAVPVAGQQAVSRLGPMAPAAIGAVTRMGGRALGIPSAVTETVSAALSRLSRSARPSAPPPAPPPAPAVSRTAQATGTGWGRVTPTPAGRARPKAGGSREDALQAADPSSRILEDIERLTGGAGIRSVPGRGTMPAAKPAPPQPTAPAAPTLSPQRIQNDLGIAARRANLKLTEPEYAKAATLVKQGSTPADAVRSVSGGQPPTPAAVAAKPRLSAEETTEYTRLLRAGKTREQALDALQQQREFTGKYQTPSSKEVRARIAARQYKN